MYASDPKHKYPWVCQQCNYQPNEPRWKRNPCIHCGKFAGDTKRNIPSDWFCEAKTCQYMVKGTNIRCTTCNAQRPDGILRHSYRPSVIEKKNLSQQFLRALIPDNMQNNDSQMMNDKCEMKGYQTMNHDSNNKSKTKGYNNDNDNGKKTIICSFHLDFIPDMVDLYEFFKYFGKITNKLELEYDYNVPITKIKFKSVSSVGAVCNRGINHTILSQNSSKQYHIRVYRSRQYYRQQT